MSTNEIISNNNNNNSNNRHWADEYFFIKKLETPAAWYNPATKWDKGGPDSVRVQPQTIYLGGEEQPTWEEPVYDVAKLNRAKEAYRKGSINQDQAQYSPWISTEWEEVAKDWFNIQKYGKPYANSPFRSASGVIQSTDGPAAINVIQVLAEVLGIDNRNLILDQAVTTAATPNIVLSVDQWSGFGASVDVGEGVEPLTKKGAFTRTEYALKKDAIHIGVTDEGQMRFDRDMYAQNIRQGGQALRIAKNQKIATELETATNATGTFGDWLAFSAGGNRTRDAARDIFKGAAEIEANGGIPNTVASHSRVFNDFIANTQLGPGGFGSSVEQKFGTNIVTNLPQLSGFTWYIDNFKTATLATVYDKSAVLLMQGPTKVEQYRDSKKGLNGYIARDWNAVKIIDGTRIRNIPGVSA